MSSHRVALLCLLVLGCETEADRRRDRLDEVNQEIERRLTAADLPTVPHGEPWQPAPVRVIVGEGIDVDRAAVALQLYAAEPEGYVESARPIPELGPRAVTLTHGRTAAVDGAGGELRGLASGLRTLAPGTMGEPEPRRTIPEPQGPVDLAIGGGVPYATFTDVLLTVVREGFSPRIVVGLAGETGQLPVRLPPVMGSCWSRSCLTALVGRRPIPDPSPDADGSESRLDLTLTIGDRGVDIFGSGGALAPGCEAVRASGGERPTVPRVAGAIDERAVASCLAKIAEQFPAEDLLQIQPEPHTPFREVALLTSLAQHEDRFAEVRFARSTDR